MSWSNLRARWPAGAWGLALLFVLLAAGVALRAVAVYSLWPTVTTLDDGYQQFAGRGERPRDSTYAAAGNAKLIAALATTLAGRYRGQAATGAAVIPTRDNCQRRNRRAKHATPTTKKTTAE